MASLITVRLNKGDSPNWGFRLQGGKDFGTPLVIQKVNGGSPAERAGLIAGDSVIKINTTDVFNLRHKDAQDVVIRAGPAFEMTIQRGGSTWKPAVQPVGSYSTPTPSINNVSPVTKTSLAAPKSENIGAIGTGHNVSAKPFNTQVNGAVNGGPRLVNKQYNSPLKLYSEESIAETLSAQTEVLSTGALGVNFKKNEKNYDATNSAVYRMLQEAEREPKTPEEPDAVTNSVPVPGGLRHVQAPETKPASNPSTPQLPPGQNICADCERLIVGVFVRIKDKNLHVECFKCSTCGSSLKNVGYYNINNKLYCDIHAKLAARTNPPAPNLVPVTVPTGGKVPAGTISAALQSHSLPSPSPLSPKSNFGAAPYQQQENKENSISSPLNLREANNNKLNNNFYSCSTPIPFSKYLKASGNFSTPKPFSSVSAPISPASTLPRTAPLSPVVPAAAPVSAPFSPALSTGSYSSVKPAGPRGRSVSSIVWPPVQEEPETTPTACPLYFPPPSQVQSHLAAARRKRESVETSESEDFDFYTRIEEEEMAAFQHAQQAKMSLCSEEVTCITGRRSATECVETISESLETQKLIESIMKNRPKSPPPIDIDIQPKEMPKMELSINNCPLRVSQSDNCLNTSTCDLKRPAEFVSSTVDAKPVPKLVENTVPQKWESPLVQALRTVPESADVFKQIPTKRSTSALGSALSIAPSEPFNPIPPTTLEPVPLPEETVPYFPPEHPIVIDVKPPKPEKADSEFVKALKIAPERPFTPTNVPAPVYKKKDPTDKFFQDLPRPQEKLSMLSALTTAPDRPYSPLIVETVGIEAKLEETNTCKIDKSHLNKPLKPAVLPQSFQMNVKDPKPPGYYPPVLKERKEMTVEEQEKEEETSSVQTRTITTEEIVPSTQTVVQMEEQRQTPSYPPIFQGFSCSFQNKTEHSSFSVDVCTTPPILTTTKSTTASTESVPKVAYKKSETITEEKQTKQELKTHERKETKLVEKQQIAKQAEEVVQMKPLPLASCLHKPVLLPQYQVSLSENAQADLKMMEKMEIARARMEQQKIQAGLNENRQVETQSAPKKPIVTIQPGQNQQIHPQMAFQPVSEDSRPGSSTFSPRPRPLTPSMINKPAPHLPYYQTNLVAQQYGAPTINLLDPTSPAISRSPSPCPDGGRSPSPFPGSASKVRPKSPAAGPPPNPLKSSAPLPTPRDAKVNEARKSVSTFIPQHQTRTMEERGQMYTAQVQTQQQMATNAMESCDISISAESRSQQLEQMQKRDTRSVQRTGNVQVERKKTVTEEFEHSHREQMIQIEKNTTKKYPFHEVNAPVVDVLPSIGHLTNPQPLAARKMLDCTKPIVQPPNPIAPPIKRVIAPGSSQPSSQNVNRPNIPLPNAGSGGGGGRQSSALSAPKRGRGVLNAAAIGGARIPLCGSCHSQIRGPFITALGRIWCPDHFICATPSCRRPLQDLGFVEEQGQLYCEYCFEQYLAPPCAKCSAKIKGDCLKAIGKNFHPECFTCAYCNKLFGNSPFFLEDGSPYCEADWNELFTTKCFACGFPVEAGDRWVEALNNNYHSQCFNCTMCKKNLEGQSFFAKGGRPFCKNHAR